MSLAAPAVSELRATFGGEIVAPDHPDYDAARRLWNARYDRHPALIVRPRSTAEVLTALRFARERQLPLGVRCGGHSNTGQSSVDGGLVIDLREMAQVEVDPERRIARVGGGALLKNVDAAAQEHGLVCPVGVVGHTGVGGLALGAGTGRLQRHFGLTIDHLRSVELITADGRQLRASATDEPELFYGVRGAGANLGIVTSFEFELSPFAGTLHRGNRVYAADQLHDVWAAFAAYAEVAPRAVAPILGIGRAEPASAFPEAVAGRPIVFVGFNHSGDADAVTGDVEALDRGLDPVLRTDGSLPYLQVQTSGDDAMGWGRRSSISGAFANAIRPEALDALLAHVDRMPAGIEGSFGVTLMGGAIADVDEAATAYGPRSARFDMSADATWDDPALDEAADAWVAEAMAIVAPDASGGRYVNEISQPGPGVTRSIYAGRYDRLAQLKRSWDPDNVFRGNHTIEPAALPAQ
jgi:FAD/FMN-containing dehydrogenase